MKIQFPGRVCHVPAIEQVRFETFDVLTAITAGTDPHNLRHAEQ
jgi:hypothetical protein